MRSHMFRSLFLAAGISLALAPAAAIADSAVAALYAARDDCGGTDNPRLSFDLGAYSDSCGSVVNGPGGVTSTSETFGSDTLSPLWSLDPSRPGKISVGVSSREGLGYGLGDQTISVTLTARDTHNKTVTLYTGSATKDAQAMLGGANYVQDFDVDLKGATGPFKSYTLDVSVGGAALAGYLSTGGDTLVELPVPDGTVLVPPDPEE